MVMSPNDRSLLPRVPTWRKGTSYYSYNSEGQEDYFYLVIYTYIIIYTQIKHLKTRMRKPQTFSADCHFSLKPHVGSPDYVRGECFNSMESPKEFPSLGRGNSPQGPRGPWVCVEKNFNTHQSEKRQRFNSRKRETRSGKRGPPQDVRAAAPNSYSLFL